MSLRDIADHFEQMGTKIDHSTIYRWVQRYGKLSKSYLATVRPNASETWRTDEIYMKLKGEVHWYYMMIYHKTRYCLANQMGDRKYVENVMPMFEQAQSKCGFIPSNLISDGAPNFHAAWDALWAQKNYKHKHTRHTRHIHLKGDKNNNRMERFNSTLRDREVNYRGLKKDDGVLPGLIVHYNHVKRHGGLAGATPGEAAGIHIPAKNKWLSIIQNASRHYHATQAATPSPA